MVQLLETRPGAGGGGANTLDQAYDQGGAGAGRIVTVDSGAVELRHTSNVAMLATRDPGDSADRFALSRDGDMSWGSGAGAADIVLSRVAANHLAFAAGDVLRVETIADIGGTPRLKLAAGGTNVEIDDTLRVERLGIGIAPAATKELYINPTLTTGAHHTVADINALITATNDAQDYFALQGTINVWPQAGIDLRTIYGLDFIAKVWTNATPTTIATHGAVRAFTWHQALAATASLIETDVYGLLVGCYMQIIAAGGVLTLINRYGIFVEAPTNVGGAPTITNCAGLAIENTTMGTAKNYLVEIGGTLWTLPYFRVPGNVTAVSRETPVYVSWGTAAPAWNLKQLKTVLESDLDTAAGTKEICYLG